MYSSEDLERFYFKYHTEEVPIQRRMSNLRTNF